MPDLPDGLGLPAWPSGSAFRIGVTYSIRQCPNDASLGQIEPYWGLISFNDNFGSLAPCYHGNSSLLLERGWSRSFANLYKKSFEPSQSLC